MTIAEVLVASAVTTTVMGSVLAVLAPAQAALVTQSENTDARQRLRVAVDSLTRDLWSASAVLPYRHGDLTESAITIVDGAAQRGYFLDDDLEDGPQLRRVDRDGPDLPVVEGIASLTFEYFGVEGLIPLSSLGDGPWLPDASDPARLDVDALQVRRVRVRVAARVRGAPDLAATIDIAPRNMSHGL